MVSLPVDYSALNPFEPIELLRLPETHGRSRQSSPGLDVGDLPLLKSSPLVHSELVTTQADKGIVKAIEHLRQRLQGWRFGVLLASATASFVLVANCIVAIAIHSKYGTHDGLSTVFEGNCSVADRWSLGVHLAINALSSLLLSASNYTMQVLNAPTRPECDKAHARGTWLDIGVTSLRNIGKITWTRRVLWLLLGFSSVPVHLFYNSVAFKTIDANTYTVVVATPLYLQSDAVSPPHWNESGYYSDDSDTYQAEILRQTYQSQVTKFANLTAAECIKTYGVDFVTGHNNVIAMTSGPYPANASFRAVTFSTPKFDVFALDSYFWMCGTTTCSFPYTCREEFMVKNRCNPTKLEANPSQWKPYGFPIDYCLAQKVEHRCKLKFSRDLLIAVIICNLCKAAAMIATLLLQHEPALVTTGDAISSWLLHPDEFTANHCLLGARLNAHSKSFKTVPAQDVGGVRECSPVAFHKPKGLRWHQAINRRRWATVLALCAITLGVAGYLLDSAEFNLSVAGNNPLKTGGFGGVTSDTNIGTTLPTDGTPGLLANILIANMPQLIFSCLYLLYNGLFTSMCLASEYSNYSVRRKPLRVTLPHGDQRSTHWLHLPYTYGVPLLLASAVLHWSISQALFFVGIDVYERAELQYSRFGLGYSVQPIILVIVLGSVMLFVLVSMGFCRLQGNIPLASSNSFAISAACHRPEEDQNAAFKGVMWGEVQTGSDSGIGHCSFTSMEVTAPVEGKLYAGLRRREGARCWAIV